MKALSEKFGSKLVTCPDMNFTLCASKQACVAAWPGEIGHTLN